MPADAPENKCSLKSLAVRETAKGGRGDPVQIPCSVHKIRGANKCQAPQMQLLLVTCMACRTRNLLTQSTTKAGEKQKSRRNPLLVQLAMLRIIDKGTSLCNDTYSCTLSRLLNLLGSGFASPFGQSSPHGSLP